MTAEKVELITEQVNIFDQESFAAEVEKTVGEAAKADKIASRTAKHISEKMEEDPAFYRKFSQMLSQAIADYEARRISETQYLQRVKDIMNGILNHTDSDLPESLKHEPVAAAFFGLTLEFLAEKMSDRNVSKLVSEQASLAINDMVKRAVFGNSTKPIVDWQTKDNITKKLILDIGDYLIDEVRGKYDLDLSFSEMDELAMKILAVAERRYKS